MNQKFNEVSVQIKDTELILRHIKTVQYAESSSIIVIIDPPSLEGNHHA